MAYNYCDWTNGNDLTGDGTAALPYKTIEKALQNLVGGDEARVAKSPSHTALSGTLNFLDGSVSVVTSVDLRGTLAINDLIGKNTDDNCWWRISDITASTITLSSVYSGTTQSGVTAYKMGAHDLGTATTQDQILDRTNERDGTSVTSRLKILGGWNLNTEEQDGVTFFKQSGSSVYGHGFQITGNTTFYGGSGNSNYIEIEKIYYARCRVGISSPGASIGSYIHDVGMYSCYKGMDISSAGFWIERYGFVEFSGTIRMSQCTYGIYFAYNSYYNDLIDASDLICEFRTCTIGIYMTVGNCYWKRIFTARTTTAIDLNYGDNIRIGEFEVQNATSGLYSEYGNCTGLVVGKYIAINVATAMFPMEYPHIINHYLPTAVGTDIGTGTGVSDSGIPTIRIQRYGNNNYSGRMYFKGVGWIYQDATNARSIRCLKYAPIINGAGLFWPVGNVKCMNSNLDIVLSVYIKRSSDFNGLVYMAAFVLGRRVVNWTEKTTTTSYVQYSITVPHADLVMTEYVELQVRVSGTTGYVYVDDFSVSQ